MTVTYKGDGIYHGLSSDTKPTTNIYANAIFIETDTRQVFYWIGTAWGNKQIITAPAVAGAELLASWKVADAASIIEIVNASSTNAQFAPWIRSRSLDDAANPALYLYGYVGDAHDTGSQAVIRFDARKQDNSVIVTRPLFSFRNAGTEIFQISATAFAFANLDLNNMGNLTINNGKNITVNTTTGTKIGTSTSQKLGFFNATPVTQRNAVSSPSADVNSLKTAVDSIRQVLIDLGLTA